MGAQLSSSWFDYLYHLAQSSLGILWLEKQEDAFLLRFFKGVHLFISMEYWQRDIFLRRLGQCPYHNGTSMGTLSAKTSEFKVRLCMTALCL